MKQFSLSYIDDSKLYVWYEDVVCEACMCMYVPQLSPFKNSSSVFFCVLNLHFYLLMLHHMVQHQRHLVSAVCYTVYVSSGHKAQLDLSLELV